MVRVFFKKQCFGNQCFVSFLCANVMGGDKGRERELRFEIRNCLSRGLTLRETLNEVQGAYTVP